jgi:hypothetical protein
VEWFYRWLFSDLIPHWLVDGFFYFWLVWIGLMTLRHLLLPMQHPDKDKLHESFGGPQLPRRNWFGVVFGLIMIPVLWSTCVYLMPDFWYPGKDGQATAPAQHGTFTIFIVVGIVWLLVTRLLAAGYMGIATWYYRRNYS